MVEVVVVVEVQPTSLITQFGYVGSKPSPFQIQSERLVPRVVVGVGEKLSTPQLSPTASPRVPAPYVVEPAVVRHVLA